MARMKRKLEEIQADALALPAGERMHLMQEILRSIEGDPAVEAARLNELKRRLAMADAGEVEDFDADDIDREVRDDEKPG